MDSIIQYIQSIVPAGFNTASFFKASGFLCLGLMLLGFLSRILFGKKSVFNQSVSSTIGIIFIYAVTVILYTYRFDILEKFHINLELLVSQLPFVYFSGIPEHNNHIYIFNFLNAHYTSICLHLLNMVTLAFIVNLINNILPKGKKLFSWLFFRAISILLAILLNSLIRGLLYAYLPYDLVTWAPVILLALLVIMLLTGALKLIVGVVLGSVNPLIGFLYTFFFSNVIGKQLSKAMLTTALFSVLIVGLNYLGIEGIFIGATVLGAYIPLLIVLLVLWYVIGRLL